MAFISSEDKEHLFAIYYGMQGGYSDLRKLHEKYTKKLEEKGHEIDNDVYDRAYAWLESLKNETDKLEKALDLYYVLKKEYDYGELF